MRKSPIKFFLILFVFFVLAGLVSGVVINKSLSGLKARIIQSAVSYFPHKISIGKITYSFPDNISLKDISVIEAGSSFKERIILFPEVRLKFMFSELLVNKRVFVSEISFFNPEADYFKLHSFLRSNFTQLIEFIKHLPKQDIRLLIHGTKLDLLKNQNECRYLNLNFKLAVINDIVSVSGFFSEDLLDGSNKSANVVRGIPTRYSLRGFLTYGGISVEKLILERENLYSQLWGNSAGNDFQVKGFLFINTLFKEHAYKKPIFDIIEKLKEVFNLQSIPEAHGLPLANVYMLDIDSQINLRFPELQIKYLRFSFNNTPFSIKGDVSFTDPLKLDLILTSYLAPLGEIQVENLKKIELGLKGVFQNSLFKGNSILNLDFVKKKQGNPPLQRAEISTESLTVSFKEYPFVKTHLEDMNLFFRTDSNEYRINLNNFNASLWLKKYRFKFIEFNSQFYDGSLKGRVVLDTIKLPPKITAVVRVREVSANKLGGIMIHFSKVYGKLNSLMFFNNYPQFNLKGSMVVDNGYLKNFEFFGWLADFLNIPSLKLINFNRGYSNFTINSDGASLHQMHMSSSDVDLKGYFKLGLKDQVSSKLSLTMSKELLKQSNKVKPLLGLLENDLDALAFDFKLSGNLHRMNFQWLQSDFKNKLQDSIPNFIERDIEKSVEDFIKDASFN